MQEDTPSWFALTVHPKHEHIVERELRNHGFEAYVPVHRARRRWSDRVKVLNMALFPGYVFCRFARPDKLRVLISPSVRGVVSNGREPVPIDDAEITSIRALIASGRSINLCPYLRIGQQVRISHGPFASVRGVIVRAEDNWRVIVSVNALGCSLSVEVDADQIQPDMKPHTFPKERIPHGHLQA
jgi:transcription antitermination factor NusG